MANETDKEFTFVSVGCAWIKSLSVSAGRKKLEIKVTRRGKEFKTFRKLEIVVTPRSHELNVAMSLRILGNLKLKLPDVFDSLNS